MQLPIFPPQALDSSVITTVWLGLCVVAFFNLRFGTTMAGLVVPGYLVPMLLVKPIAAVVILGEALATYALVRLFADRLMRAADGTELFGRDRYFGILLMSVLVRVAGDVWILPEIGMWLGSHGIAFDWRSNLHSFGLVIVALTANQFWNGGVRRGLAYFFLYVATTWLITRYVLVPFTNFDVSSLHFVYEDLAMDILSSPKAYMIILATAFFASRLNLNFGWDFSGIMVPALIALLWYDPWRLLSTLVETIIVYALGRRVLQLAVFRRLNMEGARLLLLFATVAYVYKLAIGFALGAIAPQHNPTDFFAFGYLISTLLAVKMHGKQLTWQLGTTTLSASIAGLLIANIVGFALSGQWGDAVRTPQTPIATDPHTNPAANSAIADIAANIAADQGTMPARVAELERELFRLQAPGPDSAKLQDAAGLIEGLQTLLRYRDTGDEGLLTSARSTLQRDGYALERVGDWVLAIDRQPGRHSGLYALNLTPRTGIFVSVPAPLDEPGTMAAAAWLADSGDHALIAVAGMRLNRLQDGRSNPLENIRLPFARTHALADEAVLMVRGMRQRSNSGSAQLWIQGALPSGLSPAWLGAEVGRLQPQWGRRGRDNVLRETSAVPFAELLLDSAARLRLLARGQRRTAYRSIDGIQPIEGFLFEWLIERKHALAPIGSERVTVPDLGDLLYAQQEVIGPALDIARRWNPRHPDNESLRAIAASASGLGFESILYRQRDTGDTHLILSEPTLGESGPGARYWGTYVFRMGAAADLVIEVPRPVEELQSLEYGTSLYSQQRARALLIAGAHAAARSDGRADVLRKGNRLTMFNAVHQAMLLETHGTWFLQLRGRAHTGTAPGVTVAFAGQPPAATERDRALALLGSLRRVGTTVEMSGSSAQTSGPFQATDPQADATRLLSRHRFMTLWVAPTLRHAFRTPLANDPDGPLFADLRIATRTQPIADLLADWPDATPPPDEVLALTDAFVANRDPSPLIDLRGRGWTLRRLIDPATGDGVLELRNGARLALRNLDPDAKGVRRVEAAGEASGRQALAERFMLERHAWLLPSAGR